MSEKTRCLWALTGNQANINYHDKNWGVPIYNDEKHFEILTLEIAQAGLSWQTILNKREGYNTCFEDFHIKKVANFDQKKINQLTQDNRIIRNQAKIQATIHNAQSIINLQKTFGSFNNYIWNHLDHKPITNHWQTPSQVPSTTTLAKHITHDLKKNGFKFIGPTIIYAYMQAAGLVNDHITTCFRHQQIISQNQA